MVSRHLERPDEVLIFTCSALVERYLYDVLLDDLPLRDGEVLWRALLAAQPREGAAPGQRERAAKRHLHGLPTRHLPPLPRLSLQTLDSLKRTQQWGPEVNGAEPKRTARLSFSTCTINHNYDTKLRTKTTTTYYDLARRPVSQTQIRLKSLQV